ncbi:ABC transporter ATP-binding protein [Streptomyces sp. NPDC087844]|uniref:ABC transporter ATP-binding protein n=1 Tax=Streptomyces sp. NPDC087844 TaxID=3365805 RepID=UPI0037FDA6AC
MKVTVQAPADEPPPEGNPQGPEGHQRIRPGIVRRIVPYAKPYRFRLLFLIVASALGAVVTAAGPLLFGVIIDKGITPQKTDVVIAVAGALLALALLEALTTYWQAKLSAQIGEGLIYDLRTAVFGHVQAQPLAFFTRSQTGSLVSRLNTDVIGAQQAITVLMAETVNTMLTLVLVLAAMFYLSWQLSLVALVMIPFFLFPGKIIGRRMQRLARGTMQLNAEMGSLMSERFNVAGAMLNKLYGRPAHESAVFAGRAADVRDIGVRTNVTAQLLGIVMGLTASVTLALLFGIGGLLVVEDAFALGTLVSLVTLVGRLYTPIQQLSSVQANAMTALVSFDRVFEILDLEPLVKERPGATALPAAGSGPTGSGFAGRGSMGTAAPEIEFDKVSFRYPAAGEVSLASLESIALPHSERGDDALVLNEVSFRAPAGKLTALVGRSGAGKTTITNLMPRFYDPVSGSVRIAGHDLRDVTLASLQDTVGVVTQDAHLFHETIRANLLYARPDASERDLVEACEAARIWDTVAALPNGLDTVVGDRGFRLSGGEKQRVALARLLLKAPPVVVLDEATAHLDSESEAAIQRALRTALAGRTSVVIAHRLSTIREADQILVIDDGRIRERGTHESLLSDGDLYADLYDTQFARQKTATGETVLDVAGPGR